ncbi:MAG: T9SS type A sorting domain-containing protein, partial [Flavobacteriales bacterium]
ECVSDRVGVTVTVAGTVGVEDEVRNAWTAAPNPVNVGGMLTLQGIDLGTSYQVVDAQGRVVTEGSWEGQLTATWPAGWYAIRVNTERGLEHRAVTVN